MAADTHTTKTADRDEPAPAVRGGAATGSLLDDDAVAIGAAPAVRGPGFSGRLGRLSRMTPGEMVAGAGGFIVRHKRMCAAVLVLVAGGAGALVWNEFRVAPPPDYESARLDVLFEYTLLTDDFNKLSVEDRLALIGQLIDRLKSMGSNDSLLLAMFASTIMGEMRAQLEENVSRLAIDVADKFAVDYDPNVPATEKEAYLEDAFVNMQRLFAVVDADLATKSRDEMLDDGRRQAQRDLNRFKDGRVGAGEVIRVFDLMNNKVGSHMSGHQKVRVQTMFRDMTEMLRAKP